MIIDFVKKYYIYIIVGLMTIIGIIPMFFNEKTEIVEFLPENQVETEEELVYIYVDIKGSVLNPGVYKVRKDTRLFQLVANAGGLANDADTLAVNLSILLSDQQVVYIPSIYDDYTSVVIQDNIVDEPSVNDKININLATKNQLITLPGIGEVTAQSIIDYRENNGDFVTIEDIKNVSGIGENTFNEIKEFITT